MPVSLDLFGTLVAVERPADPAAAVADALDCPPATLVHVGDDPGTDGGVTAVGGTFRSVADDSLVTVAGELKGEA